MGARLDVDYCRISLDRAGGAEGEGAQHEENVDFAAEEGREISGSYVDNDVSAYKEEDRPEYERLCRDIEQGRVSSVTFWHANRLHRNIEQASRFMNRCREHGVRLFSVARGGEYNLNRSAGREDFLADTLKGQSESDHRGERVALARKRQARNGDFGGGVRPYGWGADSGRVRSVCINPKAPAMDRVYEDRPVLDMSRQNPVEATEIRQWAEDLLAGVSMAHLLRDLAARGVLTVSQKERRALRRGGKSVGHSGWSSRSVRQILTHPRTAGHRVHQGKIIKRNVYPEIISEDKRQALITLFGDPARKTSPGNTPRWLGSLIHRCGVCDDGTTMSVRLNCRGTPVYRCRAKGHCQTPAELVDAHVEDVIVDRLSRDDVADLIPDMPDVDVTALRDELRVLDERKIEAAQRFAAGTIDGTQLDTITATVDGRRAEIRAQLAEATQNSPLSEFAATTNAAELWQSLTLGRKREILKLLPVTTTLLPIGRGRTFSRDKIRIHGIDGNGDGTGGSAAPDAASATNAAAA